MFRQSYFTQEKSEEWENWHLCRVLLNLCLMPLKSKCVQREYLLQHLVICLPHTPSVLIFWALVIPRSFWNLSRRQHTCSLVGALSRPAARHRSHQPVGAGSVVQITQGHPDWLTQVRRAKPAALLCFVVHHQTSTIQGHFISLMLCQVMASLAKCVIYSLIRSAKSDQPVSSYTCFRRGGSPASSNAGSEIVVWWNLTKVPTLPATLFPLSPFFSFRQFPPQKDVHAKYVRTAFLWASIYFAFHTLPVVCTCVCVSSSPPPPPAHFNPVLQSWLGMNPQLARCFSLRTNSEGKTQSSSVFQSKTATQGWREYGSEKSEVELIVFLWHSPRVRTILCVQGGSWWVGGETKTGKNKKQNKSSCVTKKQQIVWKAAGSWSSFDMKPMSILEPLTPPAAPVRMEVKQIDETRW